jgi:pimeloyl-ACP methyl ester carboxylesterase
MQVLRSGFYLPPPRALPYLLNELYKGPVLVLQGVLDPLNDAQGRADLLGERLHNVRKVCIEAGHCPHDEVPELVNAAIDAFVRECAQLPKEQDSESSSETNETEVSKLERASAAA